MVVYDWWQQADWKASWMIDRCGQTGTDVVSSTQLAVAPLSWLFGIAWHM